MLKERAIILIHGYATDKNDLMPLKEELKKRYNYVHLENLPGHGDQSIKDFNAIDTMIYCRETTARIFSRYEHVDIIGFSMGGAIATYLASVFNFDRVILLAPANKYLNFSMGHTRLEVLLEYLASRHDNKEHYENNKRQFDVILNNDKKSLKMGLEQLLPNYTLHSLIEFRTIIDYVNYHLHNKVIDTKTLLVWGELDQLVPQKVIKFLKPIFPNMKDVILKDMSHLMLHSDNRQEVCDIIYNFIDNS